MIKTNKISNLKRLNFKNKSIVLLYLVKIALKIKPTQNERNVYFYYNNLINSDGYFHKETKNEYISKFTHSYYKCIKTRKKPKSSDFDVFRMIYVSKEYLPVIEAYQENFSNDKEYVINIIDAGSNIGLTTLFFIDHFKKVNTICIEPEMENFKVLEFNLLNANGNSINKVNGAIWSSNTNLKIVNDFGDRLDWSFRVEETEDLNCIQAFSINQLIDDYKFNYIDILKIDIEGSEKEIFDPSKSNLDFLKLTKCLVIEIHDFFDCREAIYKILDDYDFSYFNKGELTICINQKLLKELIK
ncbi:FkbM family methyltransferase [Flavobacterium sp. LPB0248]|uniref:FkbM family methyltransferase n=1 Tax=Flavobacterium sp. LPB0248 TaxID=2614441 RepID=UPI0015A58446|nr:FkbM family methyltransferase [Flavobacterium sp. LPB0248]QLC67506.1 FkbM family methyltransferase [Flavobacterium sp. LPB0248]